MYENLLNKKSKLAIIGLGYVGLPLAVSFAKKISVIGFDIQKNRIEKLTQKIDPNNEISAESFENLDIFFTSNVENLREAAVFIIAVPTPIDSHNQPDLSALVHSTEMVAKNLKKNDYVIYESTVYPCCTEEICVPILEEFSNLKLNIDFKVGYSPERINPGDKIHTLERVIKIVSGSDEEALENIAKLYELIIEAGVHCVSEIKVAEAAKIIENTQRDVNIALINELSILFNRMKINTFEVLEAAETKWNFLRFYPGLVGGHCIGVDPYYLVHKAKELNYHTQVITAGRFVNDSMGNYIAKQIVKRIIYAGKDIRQARVLILGITFKENVSDIRGSKVVDIIRELKTYTVEVDVFDSFAEKNEVKSEYNLELINFPRENYYDAVVVAVSHREFLSLDKNYFRSLMRDKIILMDIKGIYRKTLSQDAEIIYWSL